MSKIYITGHKSPDLDSVATPIAYAILKNTLENTDKYQAIIAEDINKETEFALKKFGFEKPTLLETAKEQKIILVDHNEFTQAINGIEEAEILEIIDHHKLDFKYPAPIHVKTEAWGASATIITDEFLKNKIDISKNLAGLLLSAVLVDTVITKSPTCTDKDRETIEELSKISEINNWQDFGMELFKIRSSVANLSPLEIIKADYKDFEMSAGKFGIGQVETADLSEVEAKEEAIIKELNKLKEDNNYHSVILFITDIINEGSKFLVSTSNQADIEKALNVKLENNKVYIPGIMSRKKQVIPMLSEVFDK